jgi:adenylate cyclase
MQDALAKLRGEFTERGWPTFEMGIGINTGVMNVGNMGSQFRVAYTVVGDAVNLGSRIENLTRVYKTDIIVSETTKNAITDMLFHELDVVRVKGKGEATRLFEPLCALTDADETTIQRVDTHAKALQAYYEKNWNEASRLFSTLNNGSDADPTYYRVLLDRIATFKREPPATDWDGITDYHTH